VTRRRCVLDQYLADPLHVRTWVRAWRGTDVQEDHHRCVASMHIRYSTAHKLKLLMLAEETRSDASSSIHLQSRRTAARSRRGGERASTTVRTGEAIVDAAAPTNFLECSANYLFFTFNAPPKSNYRHSLLVQH
jgi:hypothetical protein